jgi:hypothetical protein
MKSGKFWTLMVIAGAFMLGMTWQASRFADLKAKARKLETIQVGWISQNRKIEAELAILSSRQRTAQFAGKLGLRQALPEDRLTVELKIQPTEGAAKITSTPIGPVTKADSAKAGSHD